MTAPKVTVLMPVYNGGSYLELAVRSILMQVFDDFEFIIIDDGSDDGSPELIERLEDPRIRLVRAPHTGLVAALNLGLSLARGTYLARMDADDISHVDRLALQVAHLDTRPDVGLVCSDVTVIDGAGRITGTQSEPDHPGDILLDGLLYRRRMKPIIHPSVMMRREVFETLGGYRDFASAEDRDFWLRASERHRFSRMNQRLLSYRIHAGGLSRTKGSRQAVSSGMAVLNYHVQRETGVDLFEDQPEIFRRTAAKLRQRLESEVLDAALAFRAAREDFRNGRRLRGITAGIAALLRYRMRALPAASMIGTRRIVEELSSEVSSSLLLLLNEELGDPVKEMGTGWSI